MIISKPPPLRPASTLEDEMEELIPILLKGIQLIPIIIQAGEDIAPAIEVLVNLLNSAKTGTVTDDELTAAETQLDTMIADFNAPMA